jgi:prepilin-type N-terminal cleavage/methylation domain-containing protein
MKKMNKKGFTLIEMVLVIAIIVILAMVVFFSATAFLGRAKSATKSVKTHLVAISAVTSEIDERLANP